MVEQKEKNPSPLKMIRMKCLDCCCGEHLAVRTCPVLNCPLWKFRLNLHAFTEKNKKNPLLDPKNFIGKHNLPAQEILETIEKKE